MIFLDTHTAVWLYEGLGDKFGPHGLFLLNTQTTYLSPTVELELQYFYERGVVKDAPTNYLEVLETDFNIHLSQSKYKDIARRARELGWTYDPFDRLITAEAMLHKAPLLTKNQTILDNYPFAVW